MVKYHEVYDLTDDPEVLDKVVETKEDINVGGGALTDNENSYELLEDFEQLEGFSYQDVVSTAEGEGYDVSLEVDAILDDEVEGLRVIPPYGSLGVWLTVSEGDQVQDTDSNEFLNMLDEWSHSYQSDDGTVFRHYCEINEVEFDPGRQNFIDKFTE